MATLNIDLMPWLKRRADAADAQQKQAGQEAAIRRALALQAFGGAPGTQNLDPLQPVPGLAGVTDRTSPQAGLAQELQNDRLEQQRQAALPQVLPMAQAAALSQAGLDPNVLAKARLETLRGNLLADNAGALTPAAQVNAANKLDVSPVRSDGGVFYDRFNPQVPFLGMSEPAAALADQRWAASRASDAAAGASGAKASLANLRLNALQGVLENPSLNPLLSADVANSRAVSTPQRVKVNEAGGVRYYDATRQPDGSFRYARVTDAGGTPLNVPTSETDVSTPLQKDTAFIAQTLGLPPEQAILWKLQSRGKGDQQLSDEIALRLISANPSASRRASTDPAGFQSDVQQIFKAMRPGVAAPAPTPAPAAPAASTVPPPATVAPAPPAAQPIQAAPSAPPSGQPAPDGAALYEEARRAIAAGADPAKVRERLRAMGLDPARM